MWNFDVSEETSEKFDGEDLQMAVNEVSDHWGNSGPAHRNFDIINDAIKIQS